MRCTRIVGLAAVWLAACGSENKVDDQLDPAGVPGGDQTAGQGPGGDTTPGDADTAAEGPGDDDDGGGNPNEEDPPEWTGPIPEDPTEDEICQLAAALVIELDPYQTPGDGRVVYCHAGGGDNLHYIETDISSCIPHLNHPGDVFPTTGCDS